MTSAAATQDGTWFWIIFALFAGGMLYRVVTKGWKGALFNARIAKSYGTIEEEGNAFAGGRLRVHLLETDHERKIGIELVFTSWLSWQMMPVKLSKANARQLIDDLSAAVKDA